MYRFLVVCIASVSCATGFAQDTRWAVPDPFAEYFKIETAKLAKNCLADIRTRADWQNRQEVYRGQLQEMLGLKPWPKKTPLKPVITGTTRKDGIIVENLHFQSRPGLYVTGNLYRPEKQTQKLPAILYVCGHGRVKKNNISYGNKTHYQHHGAWFARNGYVCLTIDTIQLGEIEGKHHGTYRYNDWWWINRGYTPAGVEAWNGMRAIDYLQSRKEVDGSRIGVTGRSGGGAYSWWVASLDTRVKCAVPVAGITNLDDHVVRGCIEGHCDCMYFVNTYRWDYPMVAALISPRPLLIANTDSDRIFPLPGVFDCFNKARRIYKLAGAEKNIALQISRGGHKDIQELQVAAFRWFDLHLKKKDEQISDLATKRFDVEQLKVFDKLPKDERVTDVSKWFVPQVPTPPIPKTEAEWEKQKGAWIKFLREQVFRGWPSSLPVPKPKLVYTLTSKDKSRVLNAYEFESQPVVNLRFFVVSRAQIAAAPKRCAVQVFDEDRWKLAYQQISAEFGGFGSKEPNPGKADGSISIRGKDDVRIFFTPRGVGRTALPNDKRKRTQIRRRFYLLGQTLDGMRIFDVVRSLDAINTLFPSKRVRVALEGSHDAADWALYATLFHNRVSEVGVDHVSKERATLFNVAKQIGFGQLAALAASRSPVTIGTDEDLSKESEWPSRLAKQLNWPASRLWWSRKESK